jgi:mono/diheme cytochrome c family protein
VPRLADEHHPFNCTIANADHSGHKLTVSTWTVSLILALAAAFPAAADSRISRGEALVKANCARCHAVGPADESRHPDAPPFRTLSQRYPLRDLEEALAEGITTGHPDMPEFVADPDQIDAILAYIESLNGK